MAIEPTDTEQKAKPEAVKKEKAAKKPTKPSGWPANKSNGFN